VNVPGEIELSMLDLRYESYRMKSAAQEARLLASIAARGIEEPLEGAEGRDCKVLLNGFKRYRCARKLGIETVPYTSLGQEEAEGIIALLRISNNKSLSILEQARFVDDLRKLHRMNVAEIAAALGRSKSWVSMRLGLIGEMTAKVRERIFSGAFPIYPYMYGLRQFMRMNCVTKEQIEAFVVAVSGRKLSVREIEQLAHGYFRGPDVFREEIRKGNVGLPLQWIQQVPEDPGGCNEFERVLLKDMEIVQKYMQRVMGKSRDDRAKSRPFMAQANLLTAGILSRSRGFVQMVRDLHDRSGQAQGDLFAAPGGDGAAADRPAAEGEPQHGTVGHRCAGGDAGIEAEGQDPDRLGASAPALRGMRGLCATGAREAGGGSGYPGGVPHVDADVARARDQHEGEGQVCRGSR
jgi:hypothetical protein